MKKYNLYAGLGGGFGGAEYVGTMECISSGEAEDTAREYAIDAYETFEGLHGLPSYEDIENNLEEYGLDEYCEPEEIDQVYEDEREDWLDYDVTLTEYDDLSEDELIMLG